MRPLTALVLEQALAQCARWRAEGRDLSVSINVSATNILDAGFTDLIREQLARHRLPGSALVLEITETTVISDFERCKRVTAELAELGCVVSIDDFGAGFTSLPFLSRLAVGELKLDRTFLSGLGGGRRQPRPGARARDHRARARPRPEGGRRGRRGADRRSSCSGRSAATSPRATTSAGPRRRRRSASAPTAQPDRRLPGVPIKRGASDREPVADVGIRVVADRPVDLPQRHVGGVGAQHTAAGMSALRPPRAAPAPAPARSRR